MPNDLLATLLDSIGWLEWTVLIVTSLPPIFVYYSRRVSGSRKVLWVVLTGLFSWLAYLPFLLLTRNDAKPSDPAP